MMMLYYLSSWVDLRSYTSRMYVMGVIPGNIMMCNVVYLSLVAISFRKQYVRDGKIFIPRYDTNIHQHRTTRHEYRYEININPWISMSNLAMVR